MSADNQSPNEDAQTVNMAADALDLREIDFFRLAYRRWYSRDIEQDALEKAFAAYMFHETVPPWVRHCAREVVNRQGMGMLDPVAFGTGNFRQRSKVPKVGRSFLVIAGLLMLIVYLSILMTRHGFDDANCQGRYANQFVMQWVHMLKGQEPPVCNSVNAPKSVAPE